MGTLEYAAKQAIENCLKIKEGERLVIITDEDTLEIGNALKYAAEKITKNIDFYVLEDFGPRGDPDNPLKLPEKIKDSLSVADASIYCAIATPPNELHSLRFPIIKHIEERGKKGEIRHAHMPNVKKKIMETGMSADYEEIQRISKKVYDIVKDAKEIRVITEKGTDITAKFERKGAPKLKWTLSDGNLGPGGRFFSNLPDGEVFSSPRYISGHVVIDGCLGDVFKKYGDIEHTPVEMDIKRGRIVEGSVKCDNKQLEEELIKYIFETDDNSNRIGEVGIGTNIGLDEIIGELLQDEKFPGVHIAWGRPCPEHTGAKWDSKVHCDGVMRHPTIIVDGKKIMEKGKYLI